MALAPIVFPVVVHPTSPCRPPPYERNRRQHSHWRYCGKFSPRHRAPASLTELRQPNPLNPGHHLHQGWIQGGRPVVIEPYVTLMEALVAAWLPGTEGQGVADAFLGIMDSLESFPAPEHSTVARSVTIRIGMQMAVLDAHARPAAGCPVAPHWRCLVVSWIGKDVVVVGRPRRLLKVDAETHTPRSVLSHPSASRIRRRIRIVSTTKPESSGVFIQAVCRRPNLAGFLPLSNLDRPSSIVPCMDASMDGVGVVSGQNRWTRFLRRHPHVELALIPAILGLFLLLFCWQINGPPDVSATVASIQDLEPGHRAAGAPKFAVTLRVRNPYVWRHCFKPGNGSAVVAYAGVPLARADLPGFCVPGRSTKTVRFVAAGGGLGVPSALEGGGSSLAVRVRLDADRVMPHNVVMDWSPMLYWCQAMLDGHPPSGRPRCAAFAMTRCSVYADVEIEHESIETQCTGTTAHSSKMTRGKREEACLARHVVRMTLATTGLGLGLAPPASGPGAAAAASCQARETTVGHFMSHKERYFASSDIAAESAPRWTVEDWLARLGGRFMSVPPSVSLSLGAVGWLSEGKGEEREEAARFAAPVDSKRNMTSADAARHGGFRRVNAEQASGGAWELGGPAAAAPAQMRLMQGAARQRRRKLHDLFLPQVLPLGHPLLEVASMLSHGSDTLIERKLSLATCGALPRLASRRTAAQARSTAKGGTEGGGSGGGGNQHRPEGEAMAKDRDREGPRQAKYGPVLYGLRKACIYIAETMKKRPTASSQNRTRDRKKREGRQASYTDRTKTSRSLSSPRNFEREELNSRDSNSSFLFMSSPLSLLFLRLPHAHTVRSAPALILLWCLYQSLSISPSGTDPGYGRHGQIAGS
nr:unnamed protein product [Digitaria exilis]